MLYPARESGINYRGIRTAPYMIHFLDALMNPIVRITHKEQLTELLIANDVSVNYTLKSYIEKLYKKLK